MRDCNRAEVLVNLLKDKPHARGAEIGVWRGDTMVHLLRNLPGLERYYAVDRYEPYDDYESTHAPRHPEHDSAFAEARAVAQQRSDARVMWLIMDSVEASRQVAFASLDWVFIDANHKEDYVRRDIQLWRPKVKPGGLVAGHDYNQTGVRRAVADIIGEVETGSNATWWTWKTA